MQCILSCVLSQRIMIKIRESFKTFKKGKQRHNNLVSLWKEWRMSLSLNGLWRLSGCSEQHGSFCLGSWLGTKHQIHQTQPVYFLMYKAQHFQVSCFRLGIVPCSYHSSTQETEVHEPGLIQGQPSLHCFRVAMKTAKSCLKNTAKKIHIFVFQSFLCSFIIHLFPRPTFQKYVCSGFMIFF